MSSSCPVCHSSKVKLLFQSTPCSDDLAYRVTAKSPGRHGKIALCQDCLLWFVDNPERAAELADSYAASQLDEAYIAEQAGRQKTNFNLLRRISDFQPPPARLLDIGCYTGLFLRSASSFGYQAHGLEPSLAAVTAARQACLYGRQASLSLPVRQAGGRQASLSGRQADLPNITHGSLEKSADVFQNKAFDIITAFDVIEHLADPRLLPEFARDKLSGQGLLVISTPDAGSWLSAWRKESWHAVLPHHLFYFTLKSLAILLSDCGFRIIYTSRLTRYFSLGYIMQVLRQRGKVAGLLFSPLGRFKFFSKNLIPVNLFDQIVVYARKK